MSIRKRCVSLLLAALLCLLAGCGSKSMSATSDYDRNAAYAETEAMRSYDVGTGNEAASAEDTATSGDVLPENRKWVITMDIDTETEDLDGAMEALREKVGALGGYIQEQNVRNGSTYASTRYRNASLTLRIPADKLDSFTESLDGFSNVVSSSRSAEDITLSYTDTETRISMLKTEQSRLLELMEQAETMSDLLEIEDRLTDVNYELDRYTSRLRTMDNQVDYATVYLSVQEVKEYTPVQEQTLWKKISTGFVSSLKGLWQGLVDFFSWVVIKLPYLVVYGLILWGLSLLVRKLHRVKKAKKAAKQQPDSPDQESNS